MPVPCRFASHALRSFECAVETPVWLLLSRHLHDSRQPDPFITLHVVDNLKQNPDKPASVCPAKDDGTGACHGRHLYIHDQKHHSHVGVYRNTPQNLIRLTCPPGVHDYTVLVSLLEVQPMDFSLTVYTTVAATRYPTPSHMLSGDGYKMREMI